MTTPPVHPPTSGHQIRLSALPKALPLTVVLLWAFTMGSCRAGETATETCQEDPQAVLQVAKNLIAADNRGDVDEVLNYYTRDATFLTPEGDVIVGRDALRPRYEALFQEYAPDFQLRADEIGVDHPWSYIRGVTTGELRSKAGNESRRVEDLFLMILHCEPGGEWKTARLMWTPTGPRP